jgi:hypothetical protein
VRVGTLAVVVAALTPAVHRARGDAGSAARDQVSSTVPRPGDQFLITADGMGGVRLGATLAHARQSLKGALFERTSDGDGAALVTVTLASGQHIVVSAGEDDPDTAIDWSRTIAYIETFDPAFVTGDGVRVGSLVRDIAARLGPVREIVRSELEAREYVTFERQPRGFTFRLDQSGEFGTSRRTTRYKPGARIFSIAVSAVD